MPTLGKEMDKISLLRRWVAVDCRGKIFKNCANKIINIKFRENIKYFYFRASVNND